MAACLGLGFPASVEAQVGAAFVENIGQWPPSQLFVARVPGGFVRVESDRLIVQRVGGMGQAGHALAIRFDDPGGFQEPGSLALDGRHNFLIGADPAKWRTGARGYSAVTWHRADKRAKAEIRIASGGLVLGLRADGPPHAGVGLRFDGLSSSARMDGSGSLVLPAAGSCLLLSALGDRQSGSGRRGMEVDPSGNVRLNAEPLVSLFGLDWSTFLGGSKTEEVYGVDVDGSGAATVAGTTFSLDFPTTMGALEEFATAATSFITRLSPTGDALVFSTYLGGTGAKGSSLRALAVSPDGRIAVAGGTSSTDHPVTLGAIMPVKPSPPLSSDVFVSVLSASGDALLGSTYFGPPVPAQFEPIYALAFDVAGDAVVIGGEARDQWPTTPGALQPQYSGFGTNGFVTKISVDATQLVFSTYLGTAWVDDVHVDAGGIISAVGRGSIPVTPNAFQAQPDNIFVARLSPDGALLYGSHIGSSFDDHVSGVHADSRGAITICGTTFGDDFPATPRAYDPVWNGVVGGKADGFITRISPEGNTLEFSTFLGGLSGDNIGFMDVDSAGTVTVRGGTDDFAGSFPLLPGAMDLQSTFQGASFVARLHRDGSRLIYSSFVPPASVWGSPGVGLDPYGAAVYAGMTQSPDFPVTEGAYDTELDTSGSTTIILPDAVVLKLSMLPLGVERFGNSTPGSQGPIALGVLQQPQIGLRELTISCTNGPISSAGWLAVGLDALERPLVAAGAQLWLDPSALVALLPVLTDEVGYAENDLRLPSGAGAVGVTGHVQAFWPGAGPSATAASNALTIRLQP